MEDAFNNGLVVVRLTRLERSICTFGMKQLQIYSLLLFAVILVLVELYSHHHVSVSRILKPYQQEMLSTHAIGKDTQPKTMNSLTFATTVVTDVVANKYAGNTKAVLKTNPQKKPLKQISVDFIGRLGNLMFEYASLIGIAHQNNLKPVVPRSLDILKYFHINAEIIPDFQKFRSSSKIYHEKKGCTYEPEVMNLGNGSDVTLSGYFQSWKYINFIDKEIRANYQWKDGIAREAMAQLTEIINSSPPRKYYIGVHVRRGDMVYSKHMTSYGYISADKNYLDNAMKHFRTKYVNVLFIVITDDKKWTHDNIAGDDVRFVQKDNSAPIDMAIMSMCNHTVMTTGSFGWWSAWLAGGDVVYYKGYPRPKSTLYSLLTPEDYRPSSWIGM